MDAAIEAVLAELHERQKREIELMQSLSKEEFDQRVDEFLLAVGPGTGRFLNLLIKASGALSILEIGTSHGYSTIWMAEAARETGGLVISLDSHSRKQAFARAAVDRAGLGEQAEFVLGDALESIRELPGPFDFVLLDLWKSLYTPCFDLVHSKLNPGALIVADNMTYPEDTQGHTRAYQERVRGAPGMESIEVGIGNGLEFSRFSG